MNKTHRIKVLGLLALPLLAIALAVMVFSWGSSSDTAEAANPGAAMSLRVDAGDAQTCPVTKTGGETCVNLGSSFTVIVKADAIPLGGTPPGYKAAQVYISWNAAGGLVFKENPATGVVGTTLWPDCNPAAFEGGLAGAGFALQSCLTGTTNAPASTFKGDIYSFEFNCTSGKTAHTIVLETLGSPAGGTSGAAFTANDGGVGTVGAPSVSLDVNCTNENTPLPTATPPDIPIVQKCDVAVTTSCESLVNVFLQRQSDDKVPPTDCFNGTIFASFNEQLNQGIETFVNPPGNGNDPKLTPGPDVLQELGAFSFEVHYDSTKVCVDLTEGDDWSNSVCIVEDGASKPENQGVARIGCATSGKPAGHTDTDPLARIDIYPQPEVYSQAKPNQGNGVVVQINNVACKLSDDQGGAIPIFSCTDADVTFRYLEGDVNPNCLIDATDAQSIAFRWGSEKGSLIYKDFMNLEPSGTQGDGDIDINDLQFVYGRFGSSCTLPHPDQPPVNPKA